MSKTILILNTQSFLIRSILLSTFIGTITVNTTLGYLSTAPRKLFLPPLGREPAITWKQARPARVVVTVERRAWELTEQPDATVQRVPPVEGLPPGRYEWPGLTIDVVCPRSLLGT